MDHSFDSDAAGLARAVALLQRPPAPADLPRTMPESGLGDAAALEAMAGAVLGRAARLGTADALAHMDPPTPWIAAAMALWNAHLNQNLLHPGLSPVATEAEARVMSWLTPFFGMSGGHMTAGSTLANLTALWAAREIAGVRRVVGSAAAHLSVPKAAHILGLAWEPVATDARGRLDPGELPALDDAALVLTAGATSTGAIDPPGLADQAAWTHVDAAWAGPLRLSPRHAPLLDGIEQAHSVAVSAHKWFFQPKDSAMILFRDADRAHEAVAFGGAYLATPNIGVQGSRGAAAIPLLAALTAWGRAGMAARIERTIDLIADLYDRLSADPRVRTFGVPSAGVLLWQPQDLPVDAIAEVLPPTMVSTTMVGGAPWLRHVGANPSADIDVIWNRIDKSLAH
ncbi:MAG: pyridoxal-dependent decarboxylase [Pseudomonadota bacterium]